MSTINGRMVDTTLYATVTKAFKYDELTVPPRYEVQLLGAAIKRRTVHYKRGHKVACKTWREFTELREKAETYGGEVAFV